MKADSPLNNEGYGAMIAEADFNPLHRKASEAMRLRRFHAIAASHSFRHFPTLVKATISS